MIVWLASYPRSGNTLLRTIVNRCLGLRSYNIDATGPSILPDKVQQITGMTQYPERSRERFYRRASDAPDTVLVKTHRTPPDNHPAIYVIRDGRSAALSYFEYNRSRFPEAGQTLEHIICGDDPYGGWSDHVTSWTDRHQGPLLVLRFEALAACSMDTVRRIAEFIGHTGHVRDWSNPKNELHAIAPWFVRTGSPVWRPCDPWDDHHALLFHACHGETMEALGYYSPGDLDILNKHPAQSAYARIGSCLRKLVDDKRRLQAVCDERQRVIDGLVSPAGNGPSRLESRLGQLLRRGFGQFGSRKDRP